MKSSRNSREIGRGTLAITVVPASKHVAQIVLLEGNSVTEESPRDVGKDGGAEEIGKQNLGADSPNKPTQIAGMPANGVHAVGDELMSGASLFFDEVGEGRFRGQPSGLAEDLSKEEQHQRRKPEHA